MVTYITVSKMLHEERLQEILQTETKKERRLYLFCDKKDMFSFEDVSGLLPAAKKMEIIPKCCASDQDILLQIGMLAAQKKSSDQVYTVLPMEDFDEILLAYGIERYNGKSQKNTGSVSRKPARKKKDTEDNKDSKDASSGKKAVKAKTDLDIHIQPVMNPPEYEIKHPSISDNPTERKLFLSILETDAEKFGFEGTDSEFAEAVADCLQDEFVNHANLEIELKKKFGEEKGKEMCSILADKKVFLLNSLSCRK